MRIVKGADREHTFEVVLPFIWNKKKVRHGDCVEIWSQSEQDEYAQRKLVIPADAPKVGRYIALCPLGHKEAFQCEKLQVVELTREQAIELMITGGVIPVSPNQCRPRNTRPRTDKAKRQVHSTSRGIDRLLANSE